MKNCKPYHEYVPLTKSEVTHLVERLDVLTIACSYALDSMTDKQTFGPIAGMEQGWEYCAKALHIRTDGFRDD